MDAIRFQDRCCAHKTDMKLRNVDSKSERISVTRMIHQREESYLYSDRASKSNFKTQSRRSGPSRGRSLIFDRDFWVKDNDKAHCYRQNQRFIKPIDIEAVRPPVQPVQAPPVRREAGVDSRSFAKVASQPPQPSTRLDPPRSALARPRTGERIRTKTV
jgi:hypothetical protein